MPTIDGGGRDQRIKEALEKKSYLPPVSGGDGAEIHIF